MNSSGQTGQIHAEHYTHQRLWTGAQVLRNLGNTPDGGMYARLAAVLFAYLAFEGALNYLGELLFAVEWQKERELFGRPPLKGTLGKLTYLAQRCRVVFNKGRRPYATVTSLNKMRPMLVHARTERLVEPTTIRAGEVLQHIGPTIYRYVADRFMDRVFNDVPALVASIDAAARRTFPKQMRYAHFAFSGAAAQQHFVRD